MSDASEVKRYKTSPGWYEINDVTEYNGASVRLKPSYTSSTEFKANLEDKQKEVLSDIFRQRDNMSDASEVKRWLTTLPRAGTGVEARQDDHCSFIEVVSSVDHDRIMAERDELWERATKFVMPGEMDTGESIEHYIKTLEQTIATQARVIEKLKEQRSFLVSVAHCGEILPDDTREKMNQELEAIEKEGAKDEE